MRSVSHFTVACALTRNNVKDLLAWQRSPSAARSTDQESARDETIAYVERNVAGSDFDGMRG
jgi:hypothetical protein